MIPKKINKKLCLIISTVTITSCSEESRISPLVIEGDSKEKKILIELVKARINDQEMDIKLLEFKFNEIEEIKNEKEEAINDLSNEYEKDFIKKNSELEAEIKILKIEQKAAEEEMKKLLENFEELSKENEDYNQQLSTLRSNLNALNDDIAKKEEEKIKLTKENEENKEKIKIEAEKVANELKSDLEERIEIFREDLENKRSESSINLAEKLLEGDEKNEQIKKETEELKSKIKNINAENRALSKEVRALKQKEAESLHEINLKKAELNSKEETQSQQKASLNALNKEMEKLEAELSNLDHEYNEIKDKNTPEYHLGKIKDSMKEIKESHGHETCPFVNPNSSDVTTDHDNDIQKIIAEYDKNKWKESVETFCNNYTNNFTEDTASIYADEIKDLDFWDKKVSNADSIKAETLSEIKNLFHIFAIGVIENKNPFTLTAPPYTTNSLTYAHSTAYISPYKIFGKDLLPKLLAIEYMLKLPDSPPLTEFETEKKEKEDLIKDLDSKINEIKQKSDDASNDISALSNNLTQATLELKSNEDSLKKKKKEQEKKSEELIKLKGEEQNILNDLLTAKEAEDGALLKNVNLSAKAFQLEQNLKNLKFKAEINDKKKTKKDSFKKLKNKLGLN